MKLNTEIGLKKANLRQNWHFTHTHTHVCQNLLEIEKLTYEVISVR